MSQTLRCALIGSGGQLIACAEHLLAKGHAVACVISDCPQVSAWTKQRGVTQIDRDQEVVRWLTREPFDYLLSIVNHAITAPDVLASPSRGAINYHDAPLPEYAGFNATSWAILEGRSSHAVTWHEMTADVDAGRILLQRKVDITDDDTAFTLGVKCADAALSSFATLVEQMEGDALSGEAQGARRSFHFRSDRPDIGLIDLARPAREAVALVRALDFGPDDNWMCRPKLHTPAGFLIVTAARLDPTRDGDPGCVLAISDLSIDIATPEGALCLFGLASLEGATLSTAQAAEQFGLSVGQTLLALDQATHDAVRELDPLVTKHERFWVDRLSTLRGPFLPEFCTHAGPPLPQVLTQAWPVSLLEASSEQRRSALLAAVAAYLARVNEAGPFDLAAHHELLECLRPLYATTTPLRCEVNVEASFGELRERAGQELLANAKRQTYARDVVSRYRVLRERAPDTSSLPIGVRFADAEAYAATFSDPLSAAQLEETYLTFVVSDTAPDYALMYDSAALAPDLAAALAERIDVLLRAGLEQPNTPVFRLPMVSSAERELLLTTWQDTARDYPSDRCVHELFEAQVARTPDGRALTFRDQHLSYRELNQRANHLAEVLRHSGVEAGTLVGICVERSVEMLVGLLGILKAGAAYVPLDPVYPRERLSIMLEDSKAKVLVTQRHLIPKLPPHDAHIICVEELQTNGTPLLSNVPSGATPESLAYVIFTSGSTGRPKGVMIEHRNVANFFTGMDEAIGGESEPGVWLAVTSISFDISVLELLWTLARGFEVVIQEESDRASLGKQSKPHQRSASASLPMDFGLFYFAADSASERQGNPYRLLLEGAKFADSHGFRAVWTPERHFHAFGGLYPNPAVTTAALATITQNVQLRAGSIVLPLHNPLRVAEDWAVIDQLSSGRVGLSFASGWHVNDFAFMPDNYENRKEVMCEHIETVLKLWRGEKVSVINGAGQSIEVSVLPRPYQQRPPFWLASAGSVETFKLAGRLGANVLTNMLGQDLADLTTKFAAYHAARRDAGYEGAGTISVMLHTFVCDDTERARALVRKPFCDYLASSFDLTKVAPFMFPAFKPPSQSGASAFDAASLTPEDMAALLEHAFDRYFETAGLFGTPERALLLVEQLKEIGATEVACLVDFGVDEDVVLDNLVHLDRLRQLANQPAVSTAVSSPDESYSIADQIWRRGVTHLQCTPTMARVLLSDPESRESLRGLKKLMLGGEALPADLAAALAALVTGKIVNMYGPTETTIWSTTAEVSKTGEPITIGKPIANTVVRIVDTQRELVPIGAKGELCIGGAGVVRGYLGRPDLTLERFVPDPYAAGQRLYRTGDLARYNRQGCIEFLGRLDQQVKVNGYRIELSEIENVLSRHSAVRQSVVLARSDEGPLQLVAYVVLTGQDAPLTSEKERVRQWQRVWEDTYQQAREAAAGSDPRFNIAGWNSSYTGEPIPAGEMREWLDATLQRIVALKPRKVLEIGCGTGMLLYGLTPHVEHYTGADLSSHALETIRRELSEEERRKVSLLHQPAHALEGLAAESFDTIIVNSVAQYFPDAQYLLQVLSRACELVADGGQIFIGDVRSLAHLDAMQTAVELQQAPSHTEGEALLERISRRASQENELLLAEAFFHAVRRSLPRLSGVDVQLKRGLAHNELSCFRYDVVLRVGSGLPALPRELASTADPVRAQGLDSLDAITAQLATRPTMLVLTDVPNARLVRLGAARRLLSSSGTATAEQARRLLSEGALHGVDPEALYTLHPEYDVQIRWARSSDPWCFDAVLCRRDKLPDGPWPLEPPASGGAPESYANQPTRPRDSDDLTDQLRSHLREFLPEYMVPNRFVVMDAFPQTPNGKIDRNALPAPQHSVRSIAAEYTPPSNDLERQIAEVWQQVLHLEQVGRKDNIFDLGANSLLTVEAANRLSLVLGSKVPLVSMFRFPTVESLALHLGDGGAPPAQAEERSRARENRRKAAAETRRQLRAEKGVP